MPVSLEGVAVEKMTRYEEIRNMSAEELAKFLAGVCAVVEQRIDHKGWSACILRPAQTIPMIQAWLMGEEKSGSVGNCAGEEAASDGVKVEHGEE